jgi:hypothetical protein
MEFGCSTLMVQKLLSHGCEFQKRYMKMSGSLKPYLTALILILLAALLAGPPLAFATKLPTACNIFQEKKAAKLGPCGHDVTFTKDKPFFGETAISNETDSGSLETVFVFQNSQLSFFFPSVITLDSVPLRC